TFTVSIELINTGSDGTIYLDDFQLNGVLLDGSPTGPPTFTSDPINEIDATEDAAYSGTIADDASDPDSDPMTFSKVDGPAWLGVAEDGTLSGTPGDSNVGANVFTVQVSATGGSATATLNIEVLNIYSGAGGIEDLAGLAGEWLSVDCTDSPACGGADLDGDTDVTLSDLAIFAGNWLAGTSP
ncbi:MAG: putative Ig domain-containing protein, partial [Planctomycetota bacterium]